MRRNTKITFMIILVVFVLAAVIVFPLNSGYLFQKPVKLGLDLSGGVHLVYQADLSQVATADRDSAMNADVTSILQRVDVFGVANPNVYRQGSDRIVVELPGIADVAKAKAVIGQTTVLEFGRLTTNPNDPNIKWKNSLGNWVPATATLNGETKALTSAYFNKNTYVNTDNTGNILLLFTWDADGAILSKAITGEMVVNHDRLGIFSGDSALMGDNGGPIAPSVNGVISDSGEISGLSRTEATQLSALLNLGRIPVPLSPVYESTISPVAGANFVDLALKAAIIALILVILFMSIYYKLPGVLASVALIIYALVNLAIYKVWPVTLTLAGIGGFVASLGMAVDANVLIFERMKEELRAGRTVGAAIEAGFKRAWSAIWDCNVTTFLACIIMYWLGSSVAASSLVTGFALTLFIGVALSMITAITVTRTFLRMFIGSKLAQKTSLFTVIGSK
jgi:preprotein translocase subunit SecD